MKIYKETTELYNKFIDKYKKKKNINQILKIVVFFLNITFDVIIRIYVKIQLVKIKYFLSKQFKLLAANTQQKAINFKNKTRRDNEITKDIDNIILEINRIIHRESKKYLKYKQKYYYLKNR